VDVLMDEQGPSDASTETCEVTHGVTHNSYKNEKDEDTMSKGNFEVSLPQLYLGGEINAEVYEKEGAKPTAIIRSDQEWGVKIHWDLKGSLVPFICGEWCIHLRLESMGPGPELKLDARREIPLDPCCNGEYYYDFCVEPGKIRAEHCSIPYKPVVTVTYYTACHKPGPIAGFVELPILQFYEPDGKPEYEAEKEYAR
jgi:hypothetical protein